MIMLLTMMGKDEEDPIRGKKHKLYFLEVSEMPLRFKMEIIRS